MGEVRGAEAWDMFQAMNTGHDGSLSIRALPTVTGTCCYVLERMMAMGEKVDFSVIQRADRTGLDILIHLGRCVTGHEKCFRSVIVWDKKW